jgi:flagellar biosynthetic protein FlhB
MSGERNQAATARRLAKLREQGRAPRSPELTSTIGLLVGIVILQATASTTATRLQELIAASYANLGSIGRTPEADLLWAEQILGRSAETWLLTMAPLMAVLPLLGIGIGFAQGRIFTLHTLFGGFGSLNPINGFKRLLSLQSVVGLGRSLAKVTVVGWVTWRGLQQTLDRLPLIDGSTDPRAMLDFIGQAILDIALPAAEVLLVIAVTDYAYQRWTFARGARMSKQEIKEEHKQQEGDPLIRSRLRARQRRVALARRQLKDVPKATVVVTNPTHFAVALQYERTMNSPRIVAKGADLIAQRIKDVAREAGVPIVENKPLARGLFQTAEVGDEIPIELYQAVAEVLAYVFSLKRRRP